MNKPFFLAKSGQIYGPFERTEIETLRESGEYEKYTWFWDDSIARWQPIDPPPAPPRATAHSEPLHAPSAHSSTAHTTAPSVSQPQAAPAQQSQWSVSQEKLRSISAICHDHHNVASGTLANVTDAGCEFIVQSRSTSPEFQAKLPILLHLLDLPSGRSMNVAGRIGRIDRRDGAWVYRIHWKHLPQLLSERASSASAEAKI
jgi:hypothetical protein